MDSIEAPDEEQAAAQIAFDHYFGARFELFVTAGADLPGPVGEGDRHKAARTAFGGKRQVDHAASADHILRADIAGLLHFEQQPEHQ